MSWYKETLENKLKEYQYEPDSSKMPCARFSRQMEQPMPCDKQEAAEDLQQLHDEEEDLNELV